jgi:hypothetical protein
VKCGQVMSSLVTARSWHEVHYTFHASGGTQHLYGMSRFGRYAVKLHIPGATHPFMISYHNLLIMYSSTYDSVRFSSHLTCRFLECRIPQIISSRTSPNKQWHYIHMCLCSSTLFVYGINWLGMLLLQSTYITLQSTYITLSLSCCIKKQDKVCCIKSFGFLPGVIFW